jgi:hypothetical protein
MPMVAVNADSISVVSFLTVFYVLGSSLAVLLTPPLVHPMLLVTVLLIVSSARYLGKLETPLGGTEMGIDAREGDTQVQERGRTHVSTSPFPQLHSILCSIAEPRKRFVHLTTLETHQVLGLEICKYYLLLLLLLLILLLLYLYLYCIVLGGYRGHKTIENWTDLELCVSSL